MPAERLLRILTRLGREVTPKLPAARLCEVCAKVTHMSGAGIMLMAGDVSRGSICSSNRVSMLIEDLQYTLGEGPCVDAYGRDEPVDEADLANAGMLRWFAFAPPAVEAGARAVFGFPLHVGAIRIGALNLYRNRPGALDDDQQADALVLAGVAARTAGHAGWGAAGEVGGAARGRRFQFAVHQAAGMVSAQLDVCIADALIRLRAFAFAHDQPLAEVADDVVALRLRLDAQ